jgi:hypothetical protein
MDMKTSPLSTLADPSLLKTDALIGGQWVAGECPLRRHRPRHRQQAGRRGQPGAGRRARRHRGRRQGLAGLARQDRQGAPRHPDEVVRAAEPARRRPGPHHDRRAGQAAGRGAWRGDLRRQLPGMVCRGRPPRLRRDHSRHRPQQALPRHQAAHRRVRGHHAVELSDRDDHAQGGAGAGRRLPGDHQAGRTDAAVGAGRGRTGAARRHARGRAEHRHRRQRRVDRDSARCCAPATWCATCRSPAAPRSAASWRRNVRPRSRRSAWNWAATRPSSSSTTPTSTAPSKARWSASTATPARPACAPTGCTCRPACTTPSSRSWPPRARPSRWATASRPA